MMMDFKIGELHPNSPHLFADLAELILLANLHGRDALHKNDLEHILRNGTLSTEDLDEEEDAECDAENLNLSSAEVHGRLDSQLEEVMSHLEYRAKAMAEFYPFELRGEQLVPQSALNDGQRVYRLLLACSRLRSFGAKGVPQRWARVFTEVSRVAMKGLLPQHAVVRIFDANSEDRKNYYSTDLRKALRILGTDLRVASISDVEVEKAGPSGDGGLDLVGVVDFDDGAASSYALLGQCGAQEKEWPKKTLEAHPMKYRNFFQFYFDWPSVMFTPVCFRTNGGAWLDNQSATGILLADRGRILQLINMQNRLTEIASSKWFVDFETELLTIDCLA